MKRYRWLLAFVGPGAMAIGGCSPDVPTAATLAKLRPANVYSYEYLCELGTPGYESYCETFGSAGIGGTPWNGLSCPNNSTDRQCALWHDAMILMGSVTDPECVSVLRQLTSIGQIDQFQSHLFAQTEAGTFVEVTGLDHGTDDIDFYIDAVEDDTGADDEYTFVRTIYHELYHSQGLDYADYSGPYGGAYAVEDHCVNAAYTQDDHRLDSPPHPIVSPLSHSGRNRGGPA